MNSKKKFSIAIFASGNGSNAESIIRHFNEHPSIEIRLVLTNNPKAAVLDRAKNHQVRTRVFDKVQFMENGEVLRWLIDEGITHIVLAGFLWLIPQEILKTFPHRIINIHPALLPKFGGKGMYGRVVHEAVRSAGEKETGITIHLVNEHFDEGEILFQTTCPVVEGDTVETIAIKVQTLEHSHYPKVIEQWVLNMD